MHGYMMPSIALKNNPQIIFTWLHYAAATGARMPAKSGNSRLCAISSQKLGEELPLKDAASRICTTRMTLENPWVSPIAAIAKRAQLHQRYVGNILRCRFITRYHRECFK